MTNGSWFEEKSKSRWWFEIFFIFIPKIGEDEPNLTHIFQRGWFNHQLEVRQTFTIEIPTNYFREEVKIGSFKLRPIHSLQVFGIPDKGHSPHYSLNPLGCPRKVVNGW